MTGSNGKSDNLIIHYMTLRKAIGWLGFLFPCIVLVAAAVQGDVFMRRSVSQYYHSAGGDIFVGLLFAQAIFLYAYRGYPYDANNPGHSFPLRLSDNAAGNIAAIGALGTAIFPAIECGTTDSCGTGFSSYAHWGFSALFFLILSYICLCLFVQSSEAEPTIQKRRRNRVYRACGGVMLFATALAGITLLAPHSFQFVLTDFHMLFWLETIAGMAFGLSWLVKGEQILADMPYEEDEDEMTVPQN